MFSGCGVGVEPRTPQNLIRIDWLMHEARLLGDVAYIFGLSGRLRQFLRWFEITISETNWGYPEVPSVRSREGSNNYRDQVRPRASTKMKIRAAAAPTAIHAALRFIGPTGASLRFHLRIMLGKLNKLAFAPNVEG